MAAQWSDPRDGVWYEPNDPWGGYSIFMTSVGGDRKVHVGTVRSQLDAATLVATIRAIIETMVAEAVQAASAVTS